MTVQSIDKGNLNGGYFHIVQATVPIDGSVRLPTLMHQILCQSMGPLGSSHASDSFMTIYLHVMN